MRKREKIDVFDSFLDKEFLFGKDRARQTITMYLIPTIPIHYSYVILVTS